MPHSPRWYRDKLWLLESGEGDAGDGRPRHRQGRDRRSSSRASPAAWPSPARSPSSASRRSARRRPSAACRSPAGSRSASAGSGSSTSRPARSIGFLRFEDLVQEIFDVSVLPRTCASRSSPSTARTRSTSPTSCPRRRSPRRAPDRRHRPAARRLGALDLHHVAVGLDLVLGVDLCLVLAAAAVELVLLAVGGVDLVLAAGGLDLVLAVAGVDLVLAPAAGDLVLAAPSP